MKTGIFEHLAEIPLPPIHDERLLAKADLAIAGLTAGGALSPNEARAFVNALMTPSSLIARAVVQMKK